MPLVFGPGFGLLGSLLVPTSFIPTFPATVPSGVVFYAPLNANANDTVGGRTGTLINAPSLVAAQIGNGYSFNGTSQLIDYGNASGTSGGCSISAWVKMTSFAAFPVIFSMTGPSDQYANMFFNTSGNLSGTISQTISVTYMQVTSTPTVATGSFHHIVFTWDGTLGISGLLLYIDGSSVAVTNSGTVSTISGVDLTAVDMTVGAQFASAGPTYSDFVNGIIDDVRLYNRAITPTEVSAIFTAGSAGNS